jgi:hypothetical protein
VSVRAYFHRLITGAGGHASAMEVVRNIMYQILVILIDVD